MEQDRLNRIESKLDRLLYLLGDGKGKLPEEIRREARAKILQLQDRRRKKGHEREKESPE